MLWYPQRHICHASKQQAAADRKYGENHETKPFHDRDSRQWAEKRSDKTPFHFRDGVRVFVAPVDLNPEDNFL